MNPDTVIVQFLSALISAVPKLFAVWLQDRDSFLTALDSALEASRSKTNADLARKHGGSNDGR
jgi:hypothetical protein